MAKIVKNVLDDISRAYTSVLECMEDSRERSITLTKLDEARMWTIEYVLRNVGKEKNDNNSDQ